MLKLERDTDGDVLIAVKAVPGAATSEICGVLGDRLKVRLAAPPEGGRANAMLRDVLARALGVRPSDVEIVQGASGPNKTVRVRGISEAEARRRFEAIGR